MPWPKKWKQGTFFSVKIGEGLFGVGRTLWSPYAVFYGVGPHAEIESLRARQPAFAVGLHRSVARCPDWSVLGWEALPADLLVSFAFGHQDAISGEYFVRSTSPERAFHQASATWEEVKGLEPSAVWDAVHIEERLLALHEGRPSRFLEDLRPQPPTQ